MFYVVKVFEHDPSSAGMATIRIWAMEIVLCVRVVVKVIHHVEGRRFMENRTQRRERVKFY